LQSKETDPRTGRFSSHGHKLLLYFIVSHVVIRD